MRVSKVYQVSEEDFRRIVANSYSYSDCLRALGLATRGGSSTDILKKRLVELNCDVSHFGTNNHKQKLIVGKIKNNLI